MANRLYWGYFYDNSGTDNDVVRFMNGSYNSADMPSDTKIATEKGLKSLYSASNLSSTNTMCIKQRNMPRTTSNTLRMVKLHDMTLSQLYTYLKNYTNSSNGIHVYKSSMVSICSDTIDSLSTDKLVTLSNVIPYIHNTNISCQYELYLFNTPTTTATNKCDITASINLLTKDGGPYSRPIPIGYLGYVTTYFTAYKVTATTAQFTTLKTAITNSVTYCTSYGYGYSYGSDAVYGYFKHGFGLSPTHNWKKNTSISPWSASFTSSDLDKPTLLTFMSDNWIDTKFYPNAAFIETIHYKYWNSHTIPTDTIWKKTTADTTYNDTQQQYIGNMFYIRKSNSSSEGFSRITINKVHYQYCLIPYYIYYNGTGSTNPYNFDISIPTKQVTCKNTSTSLTGAGGNAINTTCKSTFDENGINTTTQNEDFTSFQLYGC